MVHGKPRHPQSQGSVERANGDIKDMLVAWMGDNNTNDWSVGIKFVQFQKNSSLHSGIKRTPYAAMFGCEAKVGLTSSSLPTEVNERMQSEDDLLLAFSSLQDSTINLDPAQTTSQEPSQTTSQEPTQTTSQVPSQATSPKLTQTTSQVLSQATSPKPIPTTSPKPIPSTSQETTLTINQEPSQTTSHKHTLPTRLDFDPEPSVSQIEQGNSPSDLLNARLQNILWERNGASSAQMIQAQRMVKRSRVELATGQVGDNVAVPVPLVDRGRGDPRNILGIITAMRITCTPFVLKQGF
ncbi:hypothetical protein SNE40_009409 [Patella caerulea]|uniref:Integrase catalytic domain-containing protein n=1 Tax=Patella caerulea TaxID=87958 RepID=A0AAN8JZ04_PATCE